MNNVIVAQSLYEPGNLKIGQNIENSVHFCCKEVKTYIALKTSEAKYGSIFGVTIAY